MPKACWMIGVGFTFLSRLDGSHGEVSRYGAP